MSFWKRKPPTYASRAPKEITFTCDEVAQIVLMLGEAADNRFIWSEVPESAKLLAKCQDARQLRTNGHKLSITLVVAETPND